MRYWQLRILRTVTKFPWNSARGSAAWSLLPATWRTALGALCRNKMRSGLSALGVIIAVAAVIAMTEIGQGSKATLQKGIASMGANTLMVQAGTPPGRYEVELKGENLVGLKRFIVVE